MQSKTVYHWHRHVAVKSCCQECQRVVLSLLRPPAAGRTVSKLFVQGRGASGAHCARPIAVQLSAKATCLRICTVRGVKPKFHRCEDHSRKVGRHSELRTCDLGTPQGLKRRSSMCVCVCFAAISPRCCLLAARLDVLCSGLYCPRPRPRARDSFAASAPVCARSSEATHVSTDPRGPTHPERGYLPSRSYRGMRRLDATMMTRRPDRAMCCLPSA